MGFMGMCGDSYLSTVFIEGDGQVVGPPNIVSTYFKFAPDLGPTGRIFVRIFIFDSDLLCYPFHFLVVSFASVAVGVGCETVFDSV